MDRMVAEQHGQLLAGCWVSTLLGGLRCARAEPEKTGADECGK
jgi:hypothetical protein